MNEADPVPVPSILETLATLPSGAAGPPLTLGELGAYLATTIKSEQEDARNKRHRISDDLYRDGGCDHMSQVIDTVFEDVDIKTKRRKWIPYARANNVSKRIVHELATVYAEPAKRIVTGAGNDRYQDLLAAVSMDEVMLQMSRLLNLHRAMLVGFRIRKLPSGEREPVIDLVTPADCRVLLHPNDATLPIAWIVRTTYNPARKIPGIDVPAWTLWSDLETVKLTESFTPIPSTWEEHGLGCNPWTPVTLGPPRAGWWPGEEGQDITSAHMAIWFLMVQLLKESKSATKQTVLSGDGTTMARGQAADSETPIETPDGMSVSTVDMSMDLSMFIGASDHVLGSVGQNYGMPPAVMTHQGVQSAEARELMRIPLRELRAHQQLPLRKFEKRFAAVMAQVTSVDLPALTFTPDGWRIEFGESSTPVSPVDDFNLFLAKRAAGVDDTISYLKRTRPDMTDGEAQALMRLHVANELLRNTLMRPLQAISGSMGASTPEPATASLGDPQSAAAPSFVNPKPNSGPVPFTRAPSTPPGPAKP